MGVALVEIVNSEEVTLSRDYLNCFEFQYCCPVVNSSRAGVDGG